MIIKGHALDILKSLPAATVQCCVTSPPYWSLRRYPIEDQEWPEFEGLAAGWITLPRCNRWKGQLGLEPTPELAVAHLVQVFREVRRVLRDDGTLWLNLGDSFCGGGNNRGNNMPLSEKQASNKGATGQCAGLKPRTSNLKPKDLVGLPWLVAFALRADGWWLRRDIIWSKANPMPESCRDRPTTAHEYVFLLTKAAKYFYDAEAVADMTALTSIKRAQSGYNHAFKSQFKGSPRDRRHKDGKKIAPEKLGGATRSCRSVWTGATQPSSLEHYASFPVWLAKRCIQAGTSEKGACPSCGAPWARLLRRDSDTDTSYKGSSFSKGKTVNRDGGDRAQKGERFIKMPAGWEPTCSCAGQECPGHHLAPARGAEPAQPDALPQVVLDPFAGTGTVGVACIELEREFVGIELADSYVEMAGRRLEKEAARPRQRKLFNV